MDSVSNKAAEDEGAGKAAGPEGMPAPDVVVPERGPGKRPRVPGGPGGPGGRKRAGRPGGVKAAIAALQAAAVSVAPPAAMAHARQRHRLLLISFVVLVLLPIAISAAYLWGKAADQYASTVGFSVRREDAAAPTDLLGGLAGISRSSSSDTDILYEYLQSQKLVAAMNAKLGLSQIWSRPTGDPVFSYDPSGSIEDLVDYWSRMVRVSYDSTTGLMEIRVLAFTPEDATRIAQELLDESSQMINEISAVAREDAIRYSREELQGAEERLRSARQAVTEFRTQHQIVDPTTDIQTQAGLIGSLQNQLAEAQIEIDLLGDDVSPSDPRLLQANRRVEVIEARIAAERSKVGLGSNGEIGADYAGVVGDFERLTVDREFAEQAYVTALAAYDSAVAEARRKSRYLAAHILPTTAEVSRYPERLVLLGLISLFLLLVWSIGTLVIYSLKDRR